MKSGHSNSQELELNTRDFSVSLTTRDSQDGPFEGSLDVENLYLASDGTVIRERELSL